MIAKLEYVLKFDSTFRFLQFCSNVSSFNFIPRSMIPASENGRLSLKRVEKVEGEGVSLTRKLNHHDAFRFISESHQMVQSYSA